MDMLLDSMMGWMFLWILAGWSYFMGIFLASESLRGHTANQGVHKNTL